MHTYRKQGEGWQAGYQHTEEPRFNPLGPAWYFEFEAAAYVSFLNGGRYSPGEIERIFPTAATVEADDDDVHPARPRALEDYPIEATQRHK